VVVFDALCSVANIQRWCDAEIITARLYEVNLAMIAEKEKALTSGARSSSISRAHMDFLRQENRLPSDSSAVEFANTAASKTIAPRPVLECSVWHNFLLATVGGLPRG
jgi:hypothetical protein